MDVARVAYCARARARDLRSSSRTLLADRGATDRTMTAKNSLAVAIRLFLGSLTTKAFIGSPCAALERAMPDTPNNSKEEAPGKEASTLTSRHSARAELVWEGADASRHGAGGTAVSSRRDSQRGLTGENQTAESASNGGNLPGPPIPRVPFV
jgi:hypothetical protein